MKNVLKPIITVSDFRQLLQAENLILIDAGSGASARERYTTGHLVGSLYVDLNTDLAEITEDATNGGRHPLPAPEKFARILGSLGINPSSHVVVYDDKQGSNAAARFWWMLRATGHDKVQVLSGGLQQAKVAGIAVTATTTPVTAVDPYPFTHWQLPIKTMAEIEQASADDAYLIIDVRDTERYLGLTEPLDTVAGHIPNAINLPFKNHLNSKGEFLGINELHQLYDNSIRSFRPENTIVHCGSGVTACHTILAMAHAGYAIPSLYVGSWSEWCRNH
jgi:thiosulfate/3-mercaptopyruvate sulfurtransferase